LWRPPVQLVDLVLVLVLSKSLDAAVIAADGDDDVMVQTLHSLKAADVQAVAERSTLRGRVRHSISHAVVRQPANVPAEIRTKVTVCDLLHSRKMVLYVSVMCSLWYSVQ